MGSITGIEPKYSDSIVLAEGKGTSSMGHWPKFGDSIALSRKKRAANSGKRPSEAQISRKDGRENEKTTTPLYQRH